MILPNKVYDVAKWVTLVLLPALGSLYFGLSKIWNFPYGGEVVATIGVIVTFLGVILQISSNNYKNSLPK